MKSAKLILILTALVFQVSCAYVYTARGVHYRVQKGDTLEGIAKKFHTTPQEVAEMNNIESAAELKSGSSLYIAGIRPGNFGRLIEREQRGMARADKEKGRSFRKSSMTREGKKPHTAEIEVDHGRFEWPIVGELSSLFGMRHGRRHDGIDIRSPQGTPIRAAAPGEVVFSKRMRGYGNLVLVRHENDYFTVYAHNSVNLVKPGAKIRTGQVIAKVGRTGRATGPHLHFEVREGSKPRNPLFFLPKTEYAQRARQKGETGTHGDSDVEGDAESDHP